MRWKIHKTVRWKTHTCHCSTGCDLRGRITATGNSSMIDTTPVPVDIHRQNRRANITSNSLEGISSSHLQEVRNKYYDQKERAPAFSQVEEKDNWVYSTVWIQRVLWAGMSDPQSTRIWLIPAQHNSYVPINHQEETQAFLGTMGFWRMHALDYSQ